MKILISISLALLFFAGSLFPKTGVEELAKIPQLIEHFHEHQKTETQQFTFWNFIVQHYTTDHSKNGHSKCGHTNLPLMNHSGSGIAFIIPFSILTFSVKNHIILVPRISDFYQENYNFLFAFSLLQPPRV